MMIFQTIAASQFRSFMFPAFCCAMFFTVAMHTTSAEVAQIEGDSQLKVNVGMMGFVKQVVLPGSELTAAQVDPRTTPVAIRIDKVYPHAESLRYDISFFGLEPGQHNLMDYLERIDGGAKDGLPDILITVNSILPTEQFAPSEPKKGFIAKIGGYHTLVWGAVVLWIVGLLAILFVGKQKKVATGSRSQLQAVSEVDQIRSLIDQAMDSGELTESQKADLDMRVLSFWRHRKNLEAASVAESLVQLKADEQAGPLLNGLERWFYSRQSPDHAEIVDLLKPMADIASANQTGNGHDGAASPVGGVA